MTGIQGLTRQEVQERLHDGRDNVQVSSSTRTVKQIIKDNVLTYFNLIFTVLAVLLIIAGSFKDLTFMLLVLANTGIGIFQEIRSKNTLDKLKLLKMPKAHVIRDGREQESLVEHLVLDDVVVLRAGNQIPADAEVIEGSIQVNEALLTGEQDEITKSAGAVLLSGSFVVSGECKAVLTAVGRDSYISRLTIEATQEKADEGSEMIRSLDRLVKVIGIIIIPVGAVLLFQEWRILGNPFNEAIIGVVAAILGMIPEGLYMTASVAMVVSTIRLASKDVLVQNMKCIETLARVDVLCVDKTGTITETDMRVEDVTVIQEGINPKNLEILISDVVQNLSSDNATMKALKERFNEGTGQQASIICPFSSVYKYSGATLEQGNFVVGAPEFVLGGSFGIYESYVSELSEKGYRVLVFAATEYPAEGRPLEGAVRPIAFISLVNPVRENARATFQYFAENGVDIKVLSGDNPETVSAVAVEAGIPGGDHYVDARDLVNERAIYDAVQRFTVFGRVNPQQKQLFVAALQQQGKTVGMTGDGVNDILALRDADCSVAMASGSEAATNASQLVLMDSDFGKMPSVVAEGRRVVGNIEKTASLYLTKNIFSLLLALFSMISVLSYPLKPSQITLISMFTIGIPSFVLSLEPNAAKIKGRFIPNVLKMAAPAGITMFISVSAMVIFGQVFDIDDACISTSAAMLVALVGFLFLGKVAVPPNKIHSWMIIILIAGMLYSVFFHPSLFGIDAITYQAAMLLGVFLIATEGLFRYVHKFSEGIAQVSETRAEAKHQRRRGKRRRR